MTWVHAFTVSLWKGKKEDADACLAGKLRTLEACAPSPFPSSQSWQVPERGHPQSRCKLVFSFRDNPSFRNREIIKEYDFWDAGPTWLSGWCGLVGEGVRHTAYLNLSCLPCLLPEHGACMSSPVHGFCGDGWELPASGRIPAV